MAVRVPIDRAELARLQRDLREAEPKLLRELRKRIKAAGAVAVEEIRKELDIPPPAGAPDPTGFRDALKAGTTTVLSSGKKNGDITIKTSASKLPADEKNLFAAYNRKKGYAVPLFGNKDTLFIQKGRPYFGAAILKRETIKRLEDEIVQALDAAAAAIGGKVR